MPVQHQIPFDTGEEERLLGPLSISQTLWVSAGIFLSYRAAKALPPLPLPSVFGYLHYLLPLALCAAAAFIKYKGMSLTQFLFMYWAFLKRRKRIQFERKNYYE